MRKGDKGETDRREAGRERKRVVCGKESCEKGGLGGERREEGVGGEMGR